MGDPLKGTLSNPDSVKELNDLNLYGGSPERTGNLTCLLNKLTIINKG